MPKILLPTPGNCSLLSAENILCGGRWTTCFIKESTGEVYRCLSEATSPLHCLHLWNVGSDSVLPTLSQMPSPTMEHSGSSASAALCNKIPCPRALNNACTSFSPAAPFLPVVALGLPHSFLHNCGADLQGCHRNRHLIQDWDTNGILSQAPPIPMRYFL